MLGKTKPRVFILGWYGHKNSGDDALLAVISKGITEMLPDFDVLIETPKHSLLPPLPSSVTVKHLPHWFKGQVSLGRVLMMLRSDALVFGGGSNMADVSKARCDSIRFYYHICRAAKLKGIPIVFSALGLGPLVTEKGKSIVRNVLNMSDLVEVRDTASYELCKELNISFKVVQSFDPAVLLAKQLSGQAVQRCHQDNSPPIIGISLSNSPGTVSNSEFQQQLRIQHIVSSLKSIVTSKVIKVAAIEMCADDRYGDTGLCKKLMTELNGTCKVTVIPYCPNPADMMQQFLGLRCVIAERLHAAIYAYALGIPFAVVPYHSKCAAFAKDIGIPKVCLLDPEMPTDQIKRALESLLDDNRAFSPSLPVEKAYQMVYLGQRAVMDKLNKLLAVKHS